MARSWQYPRWRRVLMQGTMWGLLGVTLALAALVIRQRQGSLEIPLDAARDVDGLSVRLPEGWEVGAGGDGGGGAGGSVSPLVVLARDPRGGRTLSIMRQRTGELIPPLQYLLQTGWMNARQESYERQSVGGWPGVMVGGTYPVRVGEDKHTAKQVFACAVLPSCQAITVVLQGLGTVERSDVRLVGEVAEALAVHGERPERSGGDEVQLEGGVRVPVPDGFVALPQDDPNRIERHLLRSREGAGWGAIELVPCVLLPGQDQGSFAHLLAMRSALWHRSTVQQQGPGRWRIDLVNAVSQGQDFPLRAYALVGGGDTPADAARPALLVLFRGDYRHDEWFDAAWRALDAGVRFEASPNTEQMVVNGVAAAERLRKAGLAELLGTGEQEEWWLWYNENFDHYVGWSHCSVDAWSTWRGVGESRWRLHDGSLLRLINEWGSTADLSEYSVQCKLAEADPGSRFEDRWARRIFVADGMMRSEPWRFRPLRAWGASGRAVQAPPVALAPRALPPNYVPGRWLPLVLGKLKGEEAVAFQTEWFVGQEMTLSSELMTVIVRPDVDGAVSRPVAGAPTTASASTRAISIGPRVRSVIVQVNGSGEIARWWFAADGSAVQIDFADGMRRVRSEREGIRRNFDGDERMRP